MYSRSVYHFPLRKMKPREQEHPALSDSAIPREFYPSKTPYTRRARKGALPANSINCPACVYMAMGEEEREQ